MSANPAPTDTPPPAPKTYTEIELNERVEAARKEEKQKLYSEVESLRNQLKELDLTKTERDQLNSKLKEVEQNLVALNAARKDGQVDHLLLVKQVAEDTRKAVAGEYDQRFTQMEQKLTEANERSRKQELAAYRQSLIAAANGRIIPAMVVGSTKEELDSSATESKAQYEAIAAPANPNPSPAPAPGANPPPPVNPRATNGGNGQAPKTGLDAFKRSSDPTAYRTNRAQVLAALKEQHG